MRAAELAIERHHDGRLRSADVLGLELKAQKGFSGEIELVNRTRRRSIYLSISNFTALKYSQVNIMLLDRRRVLFIPRHGA